MDTTESELSFQQVLAVLRRRAIWILLCLIIVTGAAVGFSKLQAKKYTATVSLIFSNTNLAEQVAGLSPATPSTTAQSVQDTDVELVKVGDMAAKTAAQLRDGLTAQRVSGTLTITAQSDTNFVNVSATSTSPVLAAKLANTYSAIFVSEQEDADHQYYESALAAIDQQIHALSSAARAGPQGLALQDRAQSLATLAELPSGIVQIAAAASTPTSPSSPRVARNAILGAVLGLMLGLVVAVLLDRLDQRIREPAELETIYGLPLLGTVPESNALSRRSRRAGGAGGALPARDAEAFHLIRAHLRYFGVDRDLRTLLVASAAGGDGKTTIALNLSVATAQMGSRVLLIEADLRRPTLAQQLSLVAGPGLADVLINAATLTDATQLLAHDGGEADGRPVGASAGHLSVLPAGGTTPPNPGELLESHAMERLLAQSAAAYDLVIVDTAPLTVVSDTFPLLRKVDGVILVGRIGRDRRDVARRLRRTLDGGGPPLLGVIANSVKMRRAAGYSYGYGDGYVSRPDGPVVSGRGRSV